MAKEISRRQIETARKIIQNEKSHREAGGDPRKHHDICDKKKRVLEMEFLEKLVMKLWEEREFFRTQQRIV